jgi:hypothetical protein
MREFDTKVEIFLLAVLLLPGSQHCGREQPPVAFCLGASEAFLSFDYRV